MKTKLMARFKQVADRLEALNRQIDGCYLDTISDWERARAEKKALEAEYSDLLFRMRTSRARAAKRSILKEYFGDDPDFIEALTSRRA
jgi:hypothetical protein